MAKILIIDDDLQIRTMLRNIFESSGYEVIDAPDGKSGIRMYREKKADLIITDIIMPEKEGIELINELRQEFPEVKIIAMSGGGQIEPESYLKIAQKLGAVHTFTKPISKNELLGIVQGLLE
jgi:YesN/AraC family two-component response regulator